MDMLYALGYELYPQNKSFFDSEFAANEKKYKEFIQTKIDDGYFENYMFFKLNRGDFKRFFISYAVLAHMKSEELNEFVSKQRGPQKVIDDFKSDDMKSIYFESVNNTPYKLTDEQEQLAFEEFQNLTGKPWGKKSTSMSIEKVLKSFFGSLRFREGETNAYFRANYLAIYQIDIVKMSGDLTRNEWLSIYSAVTNNLFFIKEHLPSKFLLQYELINYCINKGTQEAKFKKDVAEFLLYDESRVVLTEGDKEKEVLIRTLTKQVKALKEDLNLHKKEIHLLNEQINLSKNSSNENNVETIEEKKNSNDKDEQITTAVKEKHLKPFPRKVVYFGGHFKLHRKISVFYPKWKFITPDEQVPLETISNAELIIYDENYNNHGQDKRLKKILSKNTPLLKTAKSTNEHTVLNDALIKWNNL